MLLPAAKPSSQNVNKANCAGADCPDRSQCRRYKVNIGEHWTWTEHGSVLASTGQWASFDVERRLFGKCESFVRFMKQAA